MKRVLVTGGTGLLGNNIVRLLVEDGLSVRVLVRSSSDRRPLEGLPIETSELDFEDDQAIGENLKDVDAVIHSAGHIWFGWTQLEKSRRVNVELTKRLAAACLEREIRFCHVSSVDSLPASDGRGVINEEAIEKPELGRAKPACNYVVSKKEGDQVIRELVDQGLVGCIVHPGLMLGPWDWKPSSGMLILEIVKRGFWFMTPTGGISVADVRDVARGTIVAASKGRAGQSYILAGENIAYRNLVRKIAQRCGVATPRGRTGPVVSGIGAIYAGVLRLFGKETMVNTGAIGLAKLNHHYSSDLAKRELGYSWRPLDETLGDTLKWMEEYHELPIRRSS